ncbi:hypothetical protein EGH23_13600 [Halomicroarcula sp. F27]|uniref:Putative peptidase inhibitor domain-containing protein n=2 Tax=Haloarcula nitratireducens TaxID=2487749 RepID=A0AAW4PCH5_9EURY|nr:hypothetical protein [Halomicroarcula nitratireducens]
MYVSRAVRSIREDPIEGEPVTLSLATDDDADLEAVEAAVEDAGATVERRLQFDDLAVSVPQERVADVCQVDGLTTVETTDVITIATGEATDEDVELDR